MLNSTIKRESLEIGNFLDVMIIEKMMSVGNPVSYSLAWCSVFSYIAQ